jgi:glycine betaine transporter
MATTDGPTQPKGRIVLVLSLLLCGAFGVWGIVQPEVMTGSALGIVNYSLDSLGWLFLALCSGFLILSAYLAFGPYGHIRLGADDDKPEFSTVSWIAMLFAAGMGAGLLFWGVAEPMYHFAGPPGSTPPSTPEAARLAMVITNFHWGLHAWSIYAVCALVIAYFIFRRGEPGLISTPIRAAFAPSKARDGICVASDVIGVLAVIFGLAGSLTMGTLQVRAGLTQVFDTPDSLFIGMAILAVLTVMFLISACTGVDKGIKILSDVNMALAVAIMLFVLFLGPTAYIMDSFINAIGDYFSSLIDFSFRLLSYEGEMGWTSGWTLTYLIWWVAWGPFVGIFIARISRGRTIREFVIGVVLIPTMFSMLWFATFGGSAIWIELVGGGGMANLVFEDVTKALFLFLDFFPLASVLQIVALCLIFIFLVTSADSGTFVVSMMTSNGELNPSTAIKLVWGVIIAAITSAVLVSGSVEVAKAMAIFGALPFTFILVLQIVAFMRALRRDHPPVRAQAQAPAPAAKT